MHERIEMKTHTAAVMASTAWPMLLAVALLSGGMMLMLPLSLCWQFILAMLGVVLLTFLLCIRMYLGTYLFLPATEYKGARIIARLGRNETEITGVLVSEIVVKQGLIEKPFKACHIRQKGTGIYLRGVTEPEKVKAWIEANFPQERKVDPVHAKKAAKKGKKK